MGLKQRFSDGIRLRSDGRPLRLVIETFGLLAEHRALELVADHWTRVDVKTEIRQLASSLFYTGMPARLHDVALGGNSNYPIPNVTRSMKRERRTPGAIRPVIIKVVGALNRIRSGFFLLFIPF